MQVRATRRATGLFARREATLNRLSGILERQPPNEWDIFPEDHEPAFSVDAFERSFRTDEGKLLLKLIAVVGRWSPPGGVWFHIIRANNHPNVIAPSERGHWLKYVFIASEIIWARLLPARGTSSVLFVEGLRRELIRYISANRSSFLVSVPDQGSGDARFGMNVTLIVRLEPGSVAMCRKPVHENRCNYRRRQ